MPQKNHARFIPSRKCSPTYGLINRRATAASRRCTEIFLWIAPLRKRRLMLWLRSIHSNPIVCERFSHRIWRKPWRSARDRRRRRTWRQSRNCDYREAQKRWLRIAGTSRRSGFFSKYRSRQMAARSDQRVESGAGRELVEGQAFRHDVGGPVSFSETTGTDGQCLCESLRRRAASRRRSRAWHKRQPNRAANVYGQVLVL